MNWYTVFVMWGNSDFIFDAIKGSSPENALENAWENWSDAWKIDIGGIEHIA